MAKPLKSQWEFGELFPAETIRKVLTVSELTGSIRRVLEKEVGNVWVTGEITNLRVQGSGHVYFAIKDPNAQLSCVLFKTEARAVNRDFLTDGQKVVLQGELTVYEARGQYQLRVASVQLQGVGALQAQFERLKQKLQTEGLFDSAHKRPLPRFPQRIGLVTSLDGAAIRDVVHAIQRRNPALKIILAPCRVQGIGAAQEIASAIDLLNDYGSRPETKLDLIMLTRGGGSLEDLWAFNEEVVGRAIYGSKLPVLSAVGHEVDFTISDFVADLRAATPTAGAELITEDVFAHREYLRESVQLLRDLLQSRLAQKRDQLGAALRLLVRGHPRRKLQQQMQSVDDLQESLRRCARLQLRQKQSAAQNALVRFARLRPVLVLQKRREKLLSFSNRLISEVRLNLQEMRDRAAAVENSLRLLSPLNVLNRGYSITLNPKTGKVIRSSNEVHAGDQLRTRLKNGEVTSTVEPQ